MNNTITKRKNGQIEESASTLKARIKRNYAEMQQVAERATYNLRHAIGKDLNKLKRITPKGEWERTLVELGIAKASAWKWTTIAKDTFRAKRAPNITQHLRDLGHGNVGLPRQTADEQPIRNILAGINTDVLLERERSEKKEGRLKKLVAIELVEAGYRALSHKVHSDKGGSDDAMRRLGEVRKVLTAAIKDDVVGF